MNRTQHVSCAPPLCLLLFGCIVTPQGTGELDPPTLEAMSLLLLLSGLAAGVVALVRLTEPTRVLGRSELTSYNEQAYVALILLSPAPPTPTPSEATCLSLDSPAPSPLPSLPSSAASIALSVVVPAYNERKRIRSMLHDTVQYLENRAVDDDEVPAGVEKGSYEVLIVDDGSKDGTAEVVLELAKELKCEFGDKRGSIKVVTLVRNRGKGGATRHVSGRCLRLP